MDDLSQGYSPHIQNATNVQSQQLHSLKNIFRLEKDVQRHVWLSTIMTNLSIIIYSNLQYCDIIISYIIKLYIILVLIYLAKDRICFHSDILHKKLVQVLYKVSRWPKTYVLWLRDKKNRTPTWEQHANSTGPSGGPPWDRESPCRTWATQLVLFMEESINTKGDQTFRVLKSK